MPTLLLSLIFTMALVGFVTWVVVTYVPMPEPFRRVLVGVVILVLLVWLLQAVNVPAGVWR